MQPLPFVFGQIGQQFRVGSAVNFLLTAEEDFASNHADTGTIAQHIFIIFGAFAANDSDAARHKFGERVSDFAEYPEFGRLKTRIMLGHGHPARADVSVDINFTLRHGVGHAVGRIAMHNNLRAGIQPADIVGSRTKDFNDCIGKTHRTQTLT